MPPPDDGAASLHRRALWTLYVPAMLLGIPSQAALVLLPLYVLDLTGSVAAAAAVIGWRAVGMMTMDIPAGMLAARIGDTALMLLATMVIGCAFVGFALCESPTWFYLIAFIKGGGSSSFLLGRMTFVSSTLAAGERGRVIAMLAGSMRGAALIGPLTGGALATAFGYPLAFAGAALFTFGGTACIAMTTARERPSEIALKWHAIPELAHAYRNVFLTAGVAAIAFMLMRTARTVLLPLVGASIGLDPRAIGFVVSISALVDVALFYPAGMVMDRFGRRATAVPSSILFALAIAAIALADTYSSLVIVAIAVGVANGLSTGIVMTLGTDLAPAVRRGEFLGLWRLLTDFGGAAGPMVVSMVVAVAPLGVAAVCVGALGALGSLVVYHYVQETLVR